MKNIIFVLTFLMAGTVAFGQESTLNDLDPFDKMTLEGNIEEVKLIPGNGERPLVKIKGQKDYTSSVEAGILNLSFKNKNQPVTIEVYNDRLKRIEGPENLQVTGAEVIGGESGNYLVVSFGNRRGGAWVWAGEGIHINIPEMPEMPDFPEIPEFNFDFEKFEKDFQFNWNEHKEELKALSEKMNVDIEKALENVDIQKALEKAQEGLEKTRKEMERAHKERAKAQEEREKAQQKAEEQRKREK